MKDNCRSHALDVGSYWDLPIVSPVSIKQLSQALAPSFDDLPADPCATKPDCGRSRRFAQGVSCAGQLKWLPGGIVFATSVADAAHPGSAPRCFASMAPGAQAYIGEELIAQLLLPALPEGDYAIGLHQFRTQTQSVCRPTLEWVHQGRFDFVANVCVDDLNVSGGASILVDARDHSRILHEMVLGRGEGIVFAPRSCSYYVSPITPKMPGRACRDSLMVTFQRLLPT